MGYDKYDAISFFNILENKIGRQPTKKDWDASELTPSNMVIRKIFGSWVAFVWYMGRRPIKYIPSKNGQTRKGIRNKKRAKVSNGNGYIQVFEPNHPMSNTTGYCMEHRKIMWDAGKLKNKKDIVHHKDENKANNNINNLEVMNAPKHTSIHCYKVKKKLKNGKNCEYPNCKEITASKYGLCAKHYRAQWQRLKNGVVLDLKTFPQNIHENPEILK